MTLKQGLAAALSSRKRLSRQLPAESFEGLGTGFVWEREGFVQIGIVSYGIRLCSNDTPGLYTRTSSYRQWIKRSP